ncbi:MAG: hypothetical protein KGO01_06780 [Burkholderiales bacterium]|nr:hypothetical protein [Burkholderiales bacterium]MDE1926077.1 hypothetical protein [Burkholderiales bacterium]
MVPNARDMGPPEQYSFPMAMGVREGDDALTARLNAVVESHCGELTAALQRHGVPYFGAASGSPEVGIGMQPVADRVPIAAPAPATTPEPAGLRDAKASDCFACHALDHKIVGPAYDEVARRYAGQGRDAVGKLVDKIIGGGSGVRGSVAMTPHPDLARPEARTIVEWILGLKPSAPAAPAAAAPASRTYTYKTADGKPVTLDFPVFLAGHQGRVTNGLHRLRAVQRLSTQD